MPLLAGEPDSPVQGRRHTELTKDLPEALQDQIKAVPPLGHFGTVEDIANAVTFLASDEAAYITGQVLAVDGGLVMM